MDQPGRSQRGLRGLERLTKEYICVAQGYRQHVVKGVGEGKGGGNGGHL